MPRTLRRMPIPVLVLFLAIAAPLLSLIHPWRGYLEASPPERVFLGFPLMPTDHYQYASFIQQAIDGRFFMENLFTSEPQTGVYVMLTYWGLGTASRLTGLSVVATWLIFQVVVGFLYILTFWVFTRHFIERRVHRIGTMVLFCFAGGIDWLFFFTGKVWSSAAVLTEPFAYYWNWTTFGSLSVPSWIWVAFLLILAFDLALRGMTWAGAVILPMIWLSHHYSGMAASLMVGLIPVVPAALALLRFEPIPWDTVRSRLRLAAPSLLSFLAVAPYLIWAGRDPVFAAMASVTASWKPLYSPWWYLIGYGLLLPFAWFGIRSMAREGSAAAEVCLAWITAVCVLATNPIAAGVKYQFLLFPPLILLAARGYEVLRAESPRFSRMMRAPAVVTLLVIGLFLNTPVSAFKSPGQFDRVNAYLPGGDVAAMRWLQGQPRGVVLSLPTCGAVLPWLSGKKVYIGHWFMTLDYLTKLKNVEMFFTPSVPPEIKVDILRRGGLTYVYFGTMESRLGRIDPALPLERIYDEQGVSIYRVADAAPR